jgi:hypothetical protein
MTSHSPTKSLWVFWFALELHVPIQWWTFVTFHAQIIDLQSQRDPRISLRPVFIATIFLGRGKLKHQKGNGLMVTSAQFPAEFGNMQERHERVSRCPIGSTAGHPWSCERPARSPAHNAVSRPLTSATFTDAVIVLQCVPAHHCRLNQEHNATDQSADDGSEHNSMAFSPPANYTDRAAAACRRSYCQL